MCADVEEICSPQMQVVGFEDGRLADVNGMHVCTYSEVYIYNILSSAYLFLFFFCEGFGYTVMCVFVCVCMFVCLLVYHDLLVNGCVLLLNLQVQLCYIVSN